MGDVFTDLNWMPWLVPLGPLLAFTAIALIALVLDAVRKPNTIPATDHLYGGHHPDYDGMRVPYQPDWFRILAIVIGMSGVTFALLVAWNLVFQAIGLGPKAFGEETVFASQVAWMNLGDTVFNVGVLVDPLTVPLLFMVPIAVMGIFIYSIGYMAHDPRQARFFALISLFAGAMLTLVVADNLLILFLGWEVMGLCSYSLIGFWFEKKSAYRAAIKAFTVTRVADVIMLLGIAYLYSIAGTLEFREIVYNPEIVERVTSAQALIFGGAGVSALSVIGIFLIIGTVGKSAQFPLHVWLPDAMEGPTPVSAMIHAAAMVSAGIYAIIRMYPLFVGAEGVVGAADPHHGMLNAPLMFMAIVGAFTALFAATMAVAQNDVKAVLAYSTISQLGFMMAALGIGAYIAAAFHLITHAFFKALLFMASGSVIHAMEHGEHHVHEHHAHDHDHDHDHVDEKALDLSEEHGVSGEAHGHFDPQDMMNMGGLRERIPVTFWTFLIGGLSLAGFPLMTAGFWSKDEILADGWYIFSTQGSGIALFVFVVLAIAAFLTAFYTMRQIALTFLGQPRTEEAEHAGLGGPRSVVSIAMQAPLILLAVFALFAGFVGVPPDFPIFGAIFAPDVNPFFEFVKYSVNHDLHTAFPEKPDFSLIPVAVSFIVALGGLYLGWVMYGRKPLEKGEADPLIEILGEDVHRTLARRYYMDDLYDTAFVRPSKWLAVQVNEFLDRGVIDGFLHAIARFFTWLGDFFKVMNTWLIDGVSDGIPKAIFDFGGWLRVIQSGRIQMYLLIVLVAAVVIGVLFAIAAGGTVQ